MAGEFAVAAEKARAAADPVTVFDEAALAAMRRLACEQAGQMARLAQAVEQRDGEVAALKLELRRLEAANAGLHSRLEGRR
jgi:hypothetical protein